MQLVDRFGIKKWSQIARIITGRVGKQCRERWHNHLRPDIRVFYSSVLSILPSIYAQIHTYIHIWVRLMCVLRAHIKLSIFRNIFSGIEKAVITFSILEKIFSKNEN